MISKILWLLRVVHTEHLLSNMVVYCKINKEKVLLQTALVKSLNNVHWDWLWSHKHWPEWWKVKWIVIKWPITDLLQACSSILSICYSEFERLKLYDIWNTFDSAQYSKYSVLLKWMQILFLCLFNIAKKKKKVPLPESVFVQCSKYSFLYLYLNLKLKSTWHIRVIYLFVYLFLMDVHWGSMVV